MHPGWFDGAEVAMVAAAEVGGTLPETLAQLAERQMRAARISQRLASALAYPALVACVGLGVAVFLATRTPPQLAAILEGAKVEVPRLTRAVMALGQGLMHWWPALALAAALALVVFPWLLPRAIARMAPAARSRLDRMLPLVARRIALSRASVRVAELLRS